MQGFTLSQLLNRRSDRYEHKKRSRKKHQNQTQPSLLKKGSRDKQPEDFLGIPCSTVTYSVPSKEERQARRQEFELIKRAEFIKYLAETQQDALRQAGISAKQLEGMKNGYTPHGFNTHHKLPIHGGGTNDFSNLILIRKEPWHDMMHYHMINPQTKGMSEGDTRKVIIPDPKTPVFQPSPQYKFLEKWNKKGKKTYGKNKNISLDDVKNEAKRRSLFFAVGKER